MSRTLALLAASLLAAPAFAHGSEKAEKKEPSSHTRVGEHAKAGEHKDAPRSFDKRPENGTWARCPVSGDVFKVYQDTKIVEHKGRFYAFCCAECAPDFEKDPDKFAEKK